MVLIINGLTFKSQKLAKEYVRNLLTKIGETESVKSISEEYYQEIFGICKLHNDSVNKLNNSKDFIIRKNQLNKKTFALYILKLDNSVLDISWVYCITGNQKDYLTQALRECIYPQIYKFKTENPSDICKICNCKICGDFHIDHILQFNIIVKQFLENNSINIPTSFDENEYNMTIFKKVDIPFSKAFYNYHKDIATLRKVCAKCNLSRPKN